MDVSSGFDFPNPYGLGARDFDHDMDSYRVALRFLSDLASGTDEREALEVNGADVPMLRNWESSAKFRRVLAKCRAAGASERAFIEQQEAEKQEASRPASGSRLIPLEEMPMRRRSLFSPQPDLARWGDALSHLPG